MPRDGQLRTMLVGDASTIAFASNDGESVEFNGKTYLSTPTLAYFTFIMCHALPTINSQHFAITTKALARSFASAQGQLFNMRHILAANDSKGRLTEDRIVGYIVDVDLPIAKWQESGLLTADLSPTESASEGIPLYALGCLHKRAKGVNSVIAEHKENGDMWATSVEMVFPWSSAALLINGEMSAVVDASDELFEEVKEHWDKGTLPQLRHQGHPVYLIGGGDDGEVLIIGSALTTCPADSRADILQMAASLDILDDEKEPDRSKLPDSAFVYVEASGELDGDGRTMPDEARHCPVRMVDGSIDLPSLESALTVYCQAEAITSTLSNIELRMKLEKGLFPLAKEHFPTSGFMQAQDIVQQKGGETMDFAKMLQALKASLDGLAQTDGFQGFKEASSKVTAARNDVLAIADKVDSVVKEMAETLAKALAEEAVKENFVTQADHEKALADMKAESDKAVTDAKTEWDAGQADKDAKASITAERIEKFRELKVEKIPDSLKNAIESMSADDEGGKVFEEMTGKLVARRKACDEAKIVLSEEVEDHIVLTLADTTDEVFNSTLELWKSLGKGKVTASGDKGKRFVPNQKETDDIDKNDFKGI